MNINSEFSPKKGFFREADKGGGGGGGKDDEGESSSNNEQEDAKGATMKTEKEILDNVLPILGADIKKTAQLIDDLEAEAAIEVLEQSRDLAMWYKTSSPKETAALAFLKKKLEEKAAELGYSFEDELEESEGSVGGAESVGEMLDDEEKKKLLEEINYVWDMTLNTTYRHLQISQEPELMDHVERIKAGIEKLYGKKSNLAKLFDLSINIRDLANDNAGETKHLCANNVENLLKMLKASKLTKEDVNNFKKIVLVESENSVNEHTVKEIFDFICNQLLFVADEEDRVKAQKGYEWYKINKNANSDASKKEDKYHLDQKEYYNFARDGDRYGVLQDIVKDKFPFLNELPSFVLDSIIYQVIIQGARYDAFAPYYTYYQASPIFGMNAEWYSSTNPLISILYSIASSPPIPSGKTLLQVVRLPEPDHYRDEKGEKLDIVPLTPNEGLERKNLAYAKAYSKSNRFTKYSEAMEERYYGEDNIDQTKKEEAETRKKKTLHAWRTLINVRNSLCEIVSPSFDIGYVVINPDFKFLPSLHDVYEGRWMRQNPKKNIWEPQEHRLDNLSIQDYIEIQERFGEFLALVDKPPHLENRIDLGSEMKKAYSATSKFKAIFSSLKIDKDTPEDHPFYDFLQIVRLMYVIYIKKLFNKYVDLPPIPGWANFERADKEFLSVIENSLKQETGTIPEAIAGYLLKEVIEPAREGRSKYSAIFNNTASAESWIAKEIKKGTEYARLFERWVKEPTSSEKDPNKE